MILVNYNLAIKLKGKEKNTWNLINNIKETPCFKVDHTACILLSHLFIWGGNYQSEPNIYLEHLQLEGLFTCCN